MKKPRAFSGSKKVCHICGMKIPSGYVDQRHPLFATVDHVIPKSANGGNAPENLKASHRICNLKKGNRLEVPQCDIDKLREAVSRLLPKDRRITVPLAAKPQESR